MGSAGGFDGSTKAVVYKGIWVQGSWVSRISANTSPGRYNYLLTYLLDALDAKALQGMSDEWGMGINGD